IYEPEVIGADDFDARHLAFINASLRELEAALAERGGRLITRVGEAVEVIATLHDEIGFEAIHAHQETGNGMTYARDLRVADWARRSGVEVIEHRQHGVTRRLADRDGWARDWQALMSAPQVATPETIETVAGPASDGIEVPESFGLEAGDASHVPMQQGGEARAAEVLRSFLAARGEHYRSDLSSPVSAGEACSRLSPYLAYGNISLRRVYQRTEHRLLAIRRERRGSPWLKSLQAFGGRLRWHCHFMQKLEDEPAIEYRNMNRAFDGLREDEFNETWFQAWQEGLTGYPLVDACMRALRATGWINFRMRAMLVSFASYHLWLHWPRPAAFLARQFLDYEPGIHYSQFQMQSGTTGINAVRIYSPIKQVLDQDPDGVFIREWVPELAGVPAEHIAQPHLMPALLQESAGCVIGRDYPAPIVDHATAYNAARQRIFRARGSFEARTESRRVFVKHGSRRGARSRMRG
ncbi:MAG: deoxyribodipyrimidine photo-lyase/cryptochrome family protein, partial [Gammaproteobacteria bacterium]|nr:deoxyribodipyrimidine photo-lyase/cryptochrome family protein [Gammaproteobacteria bacterium]